MKKQSAVRAWKLLILSLPKGIASFVTVVAGLCVSLPLSVFVIGLPLLAETLVLCRRLMENERRQAEAWRQGLTKKEIRAQDQPAPEKWAGWRALLAVLGQARSYRSIVYSMAQLAVGIAAFTTAVVIPVTAFAVLLSPAAYEVSMRYFSFDLFADAWFRERLFPELQSYQLSWIAGGVGALFVLLTPFLLRVMGRMYTGWVVSIAGPEQTQSSAEPQTAAEYPLETRRELQPNG